MLEGIDAIMDTNIIKKINSQKDLSFLKMEFRIAGTSYSKKSSGNRCILSLYQKQKEVKILLVYSKTDLPSKGETAEWKKMIRNNYTDYDFCK